MNASKLLKPVLVLSLASFSLAAAAKPGAESLAGASDGPQLSSYASKSMELGFASHDYGSSTASGETVVEETPDGKSFVLKIDPISGEISAAPSH